MCYDEFCTEILVPNYPQGILRFDLDMAGQKSGTVVKISDQKLRQNKEKQAPKSWMHLLRSVIR